MIYLTMPSTSILVKHVEPPYSLDMKTNATQTKPLPKIEDIRGRSYATFTNAGVFIDVRKYLATPSGKKALKRVAQVISESSKNMPS